MFPEIYYNTKTDIALPFSHDVILFSNPYPNPYSKQQIPGVTSDQPRNPLTCHCVCCSKTIPCFSSRYESVCGMITFTLKAFLKSWRERYICLGYVILAVLFVVHCSVCLCIGINVFNHRKLMWCSWIILTLIRTKKENH